MAKQTVNIGSTANDGTGDQLRTAFDKLNQNNDEIYGANFVTEDMLNDNIVGADELKVTGNGAAGQILTSNADGTFSWTTGVTGDITGVEAGDGLTGGGTGGDVTLNVAAGTGITVTANEVALDTTVQDEITLNTAKVGITTAQAADIVTNNGKVSDQTVTLTEGANVTITGTYPDFTIASDDVVGAVTSVNTEVGAVVLDTADIAENTNLYYTEARVAANSAVAANTAKTGITTAQAGEITANNAKVTNATHTGDVTGDGVLTIANNVVNATKLDVTGDGTAGQLLQSDGDGSMTWVTGVTGDITAVTAGDGLTGGGTGGDVTVSLDANVAGDGLTLTTGVLSVDTIQTGDVADDAITSPKLAEFDDTFTAGTTGDIIVSNGTDFIHATMSGDATIVAGGAITIADDAVDADKLADSINTLISNNTAKLTNATHTGEVTGDGALTITDGAVVADRLATDAVTTVKIADDAVDYDKLSTEFTTSAAISALDVDFSSAAVFTKALSGTTTLTFSNVETGMVKTLVISGNQSLVLPSGVTILNGAYLGTATTNVIQIVSTNGSTQMFATISNV